MWGAGCLDTDCDVTRTSKESATGPEGVQDPLAPDHPEWDDWCGETYYDEFGVWDADRFGAPPVHHEAYDPMLHAADGEVVAAKPVPWLTLDMWAAADEDSKVALLTEITRQTLAVVTVDPEVLAARKVLRQVQAGELVPAEAVGRAVTAAITGLASPQRAQQVERSEAGQPPPDEASQPQRSTTRPDNHSTAPPDDVGGRVQIGGNAVTAATDSRVVNALERIANALETEEPWPRSGSRTTGTSQSSPSQRSGGRRGDLSGSDTDFDMVSREVNKAVRRLGRKQRRKR